jgi:probable HAF family extracellular repeat protein
MTTDSVSVLLRYEESNMKLRTLICIIAGVAALMALALPAQLSAQQPRYKIVDLGTLGGPNSFIDCCGVQPVLNNRGTIVGGAETSVPNPNFNLSPTESFLCGSPDPLVNPAFKWEKGVLTNLGTLPGGYNSFAAFVSESDLIAGTSETGLTDPLLGGPQCHPTLWADGQIIDLGTLGGYQGVALESNNGGQVVGVATNKVPDSFLGLFANTVPSGFQPGTEQRAFLWERGMILDLGTLGGPDAAAALINDRGQIAGVSYTNSTVNASTGIPTQDPFLWEQGRIQDLGSLGGTFGFPSDLNSRGEVVGVMNLAGDVNFHGFLWDRGVRTDLGTLGGNDSEAFSINAGGQVVGTADVTGSLTHHAFLWKNGGMTDLGTLPGQACSTALSINSKEQVVGETGVCFVGGGPPFISEHGAPMVDLTTLILPGSDLAVVDASYINERGEIACQADDANGNVHACLLVPATSAEIAAAKAITESRPTPTVHTFIKNSENSVSGGRNRALNRFRWTQRLP